MRFVVHGHVYALKSATEAIHLFISNEAVTGISIQTTSPTDKVAAYNGLFLAIMEQFFMVCSCNV